MMNLTELFCHVDDFWLAFAPEWQRNQLREGSKQRQRAGQLCESEIMTLMIYFHQARYRDFKTYYTEHVKQHLQSEFPNLVSYSRFVQLMPRILLALCAYLRLCYGQCRGIAFIDSTALAVCHNRRISQHQVFDGIAERGHTSVDWFYGFKLHLVINQCGELLACQITSGNVDDRQPVPILAKHLFGKLIADRGYVSQALFEQLLETFGVQLITKLRKNMKNRLLPLMDKLLLRKRAIIESVVDQLKNISQIEHTRHRSPIHCFLNIIAGLVAYCHQPKKPSLNLFPSAFLSA